MIRWFRRFIDLLDSRTGPDLLYQLHRSIEVIQERAQVCIDLLERLVFCIGVEPIVADGPPDGDVIFLLDETVVVLPVRTSAGEGNVGVTQYSPEALPPS